MTRIFNTAELMVDEKGQIYHLGLKPEDIADIIICVGDPDRVEMISRHFDRIEVKKRNREFVTHTGYFHNRRLSVISSGIGVDNMEIVMHELDALANIDLQQRKVNSALKSLRIIRLGTSGSLVNEIPLNSFIISNYAIGLDTLFNFYPIPLSAEEKEGHKQLITYFGRAGKILHPYFIKGCSQLLAQLQEGCHQGITVTAPGFFAAQGRLLRVKPIFPELLELFRHFSFLDKSVVNLEMETSSLYSFGNMLNHHCITITAVITNRMTGEMSKNPQQAVENLIETMLPRIANLPESISGCANF